jgi:tRNA dimethylallyltransferase
MLQSGLEEETLALFEKGYGRDLKPMQAIGYRHMIGHLCDKWPIDETERLLARDTRRYAKRQYTWFKKMDIDWIEVSQEKDVFSRITAFLN